MDPRKLQGTLDRGWGLPRILIINLWLPVHERKDLAGGCCARLEVGNVWPGQAQGHSSDESGEEDGDDLTTCSQQPGFSLNPRIASRGLLKLDTLAERLEFQQENSKF